MHLSTTVRSTRATDIITALATAATAKVYAGSMPTNGAALSGNTLLATLTLANPAGTVGVVGNTVTLTFSTITGDSAADNAGRPTFVRFANSVGTYVMDLTAGSTGGGTSGEVQFPADFTVGLPIGISSFTLTEA
jgi:hypothetical protein